MDIDHSKLDALNLIALRDISGAYAGVMISLGHKLGLYKVMAGAGPLAANEVARKSGCAERYVREWLGSQVAGSYVDYHPTSETYELTAEQALVLADESSPFFRPSSWQVPASMWFDEPKTLEAFRTGRGVAWGEHDERLFCGVASFYRNAYQACLVPQWLPALDGVTDKLERGADVADVGCGHGHSTIIMAQAYPSSRFWGFDVHAGSIAEAKVNAERAGVADRVTFEVANAADYPGCFDLVCFFDALHDMGFPGHALRHARERLTADGSIMLIEPAAGDRLEDNINIVSRMYYAASATMCCAHAISERGTHVLGAQAGEARLADVARASGLTSFRTALKTPFNLVIELRR